MPQVHALYDDASREFLYPSKETSGGETVIYMFMMSRILSLSPLSLAWDCF